MNLPTTKLFTYQGSLPEYAARSGFAVEVLRLVDTCPVFGHIYEIYFLGWTGNVFEDELS